MSTITKKDLVDRIADQSSNKRVVVKKIVQSFLDEIVAELGKGNRLEFRDFGVFEIRSRAARVAQTQRLWKGLCAGKTHGQVQDRPPDEAAPFWRETQHRRTTPPRRQSRTPHG